MSQLERFKSIKVEDVKNDAISAHLDEFVTPLKLGIYVLEIDRVVGEHREVLDAQRAALDAGALSRVVDRFVPAGSDKRNGEQAIYDKAS